MNNSRDDYYKDTLSGEMLELCYEVAPPRVKQYLKEEVNFALSKIKKTDTVLELGCGYGRVLSQLSFQAKVVYGIDTSAPSLALAQKRMIEYKNCVLLHMDAAKLLLPEKMFDVVICIQNGISAFKRKAELLIGECMRVTKPGGKILISTYAEKFWEHRLSWFREQAKAGCIGVIDEKKTGKGVIVCKDGFTATTYSIAQFKDLTRELGAQIEITEVDESSLFCEIITGK
ncbi:MAG: class I SAM-dependent methyltransferase [Bacteroidota bacterium]